MARAEMDEKYCTTNCGMMKDIHEGIKYHPVKVSADDSRGIVQQLDPADKKRVVLAIGAHPDDIELGVGMTIYDHVKRGDYVFYAVCTDGSGSYNAFNRIGETNTAADKMGVSGVFLLDLPDTNLDLRGADLRINLERVVQHMGGAHTIYTHTVNDRHQDHRAVALTSKIIGRDALEILCYAPPSHETNFEPHFYHSFAREHLEAKLDVLKVFKSQVERGIIDLEDVVSTGRYFRQRFSTHPNSNDRKWAEAFEANHVVRLY